MSKVIIFGEGKIADVVYFYLTNDSPHTVVGFSADKHYITHPEKWGLPVIPFENIQQEYPANEFEMFIAIGYQNLNQFRAEKYQAAKDLGYKLVTYISSKAGNFGNVQVGDNCLILDNSTLQPCCKIGNNVIIWSNNLIGHHSTIEDHCYIAGNVTVAGHTTINPYCFIGVNASIGHEIKIGEKCLVGAGSIITKNAEPKSVFIQNDTPKIRLDSSSFIKLTKL